MAQKINVVQDGIANQATPGLLPAFTVDSDPSEGDGSALVLGQFGQTAGADSPADYSQLVRTLLHPSESTPATNSTPAAVAISIPVASDPAADLIASDGSSQNPYAVTPSSASESSAGTEAPPGSAPTAAATAQEGTGSAGGTHLTINVTYDASVSGAPAGFQTAFALAIGYFEKAFADPITININVGWGEVNGQALSAGALGSSIAFQTAFTYSQALAALQGDAKTAADQQAVASLPPSNKDPTGGANFALSTAQQKAIGLLTTTSGVDGFVGFSSDTVNNPFSFDPYNRAVWGSYDFIGVAAHEISEILGRTADLGKKDGSITNAYRITDLFRFSAPGTRQLTSGNPSYFSIDGGQINLGDWNNPVTGNSGDLGDWAGKTPYFPDSFNDNSNAGVINPVTGRDITLMDVLGYDFVQPLVHFVGVTPSSVANWNDKVTDKNGNIIGTAWENSAIPSFNDDVEIDSPFQVTLNGKDLNGNPVAVDSITIGAGASLIMSAPLTLGSGQTNNDVSLHLASGGALSISDGQALTLRGTVNNVGTITLHAYQSGRTALQIYGDVILEGKGSIVSITDAYNQDEITGWSTTTTATLHNRDNTILGGGTIDGKTNLFVLDNQGAGIVNADDAALPMAIDTLLVDNDGVIEATGHGNLSITNSKIVQTNIGVLGGSGFGNIAITNLDLVGGTITNPGAGKITFSGTKNTIDGSTAAGAVTNLGPFTITDGALVTLAGTLANQGQIILHAYQSGDTELDVAGDVTLQGGGSIVMTTDAYNQNQITGSSPTQAAVLHNVNNTISGFGTFDAKTNKFSLDNQAGGTINANDSGNQIIFDTLTVGNAGLIEDTGAAGLKITHVTFIQTAGGMLTASGANTHIELDHTTLSGGVFTTSGGGKFNVAGAGVLLDGSAAPFNNSGFFNIPDGQILTLRGTINNTGTITLHAYQSGNTELDADGDVTLQGGGSIVMTTDAYNQNQITGSSPTKAAVLHNVNNTISGFGTFDAKTNKFLLDNQAAGVINANDSGNQIIFDTLTVGNAGLIEDTGAGGMKLTNVTFTQSAGGKLIASGKGTHIELDHTTLSGGTFTSSGGGFFNIAGPAVVLDGSATPFNNSGLFNIPDGQILTLRGTINNTGTITLSGYQSGNTELDADGDVTLQGGGSIVMTTAAYNQNQITGSGAPWTLHNTGNTIMGLGVIGGSHPLVLDNAGGTIDANANGSTLTISTGSTVSNTGTFEAMGGGILVVSDAVNNGKLIEAANGGTVTLNGTIASTGVLETDGGVLTVNGAVTGAGSALITGGGTLRFGISASFQQDVAFSGAGSLILPEAAASAGGYIGHISGWNTNDTVDVAPLTFSSSYHVLIGTSGANQGLFVVDSAKSDALVAQMNLTGSYSANQFLLSDDNHGGTLLSLTTPVCFCRGTFILTDRGEVPVEELAVGDRVKTLSGEVKPVVWIGMGRDLVTCANKLARPVIVRRGALAENVPQRDLYLTHGHALYLDGVLIPVENLINHRSILWDDTARVVEYYHIELEDHDAVFAEGAAAETYYDASNRARFHNTRPGSAAGDGRVPFAPVLSGGAAVERIWQELFARSGGRVESDTTDDPDLHLVVDGRRLDAAGTEGGAYIFAFDTAPDGAPRLRSRSAVPSLLGISIHDHRRLGIAIARIELEQPGLATVVEHDAPLLIEGGCHSAESGYAWTDGELVLPGWLFAHLSGAFTLTVHIERPGMRYPRHPAAVAAAA